MSSPLLPPRENFNHTQRDQIFDLNQRVFIKNDYIPSGISRRFHPKFKGPYTIIGHYHDNPSLLQLQDQNGEILPPVNIEKLIKLPDQTTDDIRIDNFESPSTKTAELPLETLPQSQTSHPDIATLAFHFASVLKNYPSHSTYSSEACKQVHKTTLLQENYSPVTESYED